MLKKIPTVKQYFMEKEKRWTKATQLRVQQTWLPAIENMQLASLREAVEPEPSDTADAEANATQAGECISGPALWEKINENFRSFLIAKNSVDQNKNNKLPASAQVIGAKTCMVTEDLFSGRPHNGESVAQDWHI